MGFAGATEVLQPCAPGRKLGDFQLLAELSRGRRSTSYAALSADGSPKLLRVFHEVDGVAALEAELRAAGGLRLGAAPPSVEAEEGQVFAVDALLVGESLASVLTRIVEAETPMPPEVAVSIALLAIRSLRRASGRHGDLIPAHLLLSFEGDVWLIDPAGPAELGGRRALKGRACYRPPELRGGAAATELGDLYQLGGGLFEAVSACPLPIPGAPAEPPRGKAPDMSQVPEALHRALHRLLRTRPEVRFSGLEAAEAALAGSLGEVQLGSAVIARWMRTFFSDRLARWRALVLRPAEQARAAAEPPPSARLSPEPFPSAAPVEVVDAATESEPDDALARAARELGAPNAWKLAAERGPQLDDTDEAETTTRALALTPPGLWSELAEDPAEAPLESVSEDVGETYTNGAPLLELGADEPQPGPKTTPQEPLFQPLNPDEPPKAQATQEPLFRPLSGSSADWSSVPWSALLSESQGSLEASETPQVSVGWIPPEAVAPDRPASGGEVTQLYEAPADPTAGPKSAEQPKGGGRSSDMLETLEEQDLSKGEQGDLAKLTPLIISRAPPARLGGAAVSDFGSNGQAHIPTQVVRLRGDPGDSKDADGETALIRVRELGDGSGAADPAEAAPERAPTREDSVELEISFSEAPEDVAALLDLSEALEPSGGDAPTGAFFAPEALSTPPAAAPRVASAPTLTASSAAEVIEAPSRRPMGLFVLLFLLLLVGAAIGLWAADGAGLLPESISAPLRGLTGAL